MKCLVAARGSGTFRQFMDESSEMRGRNLARFDCVFRIIETGRVIDVVKLNAVIMCNVVYSSTERLRLDK